MLVGKELGPYLIDKELGSGAMGTVFRAKHKTTGSRVAIKLMALALGSNEAALNRFTREITIIKQLDHPNIVKYINSGKYHKSPFIIMEFIDGESLDHAFARKKRLSWEEVVEIGIHLCAGLQHAHDRGIIHRDLKPSNLMMLKDGTVKLTDFGIAKDTDVTALTAANSTVGTAAYMSPEQCRGQRDITHKSDLYSMGIMFYELLTGRKPFVGESAMEVFQQHAHRTDYRRPQEIVMEIPIWLDTLVVQLMEKEPGKRPLSASAVADSLRLIKDKVEAQRSAGVEAVTKRRVDKTAGDKKIDKEDTEIARTVAGKKKKKAPPIYTRGWFTILALSLVGLSACVCGYLTFLRVPSAESLYIQAEGLLKSASADDRKAAREGPLTLFLHHYRDHEKSEQMQRWADQYDFETLDQQMRNRRGGRLKLKQTPEEELYNKALDAEEAGRLDDAGKHWQELSKNKGGNGPDLHAFGLIGERYLQTYAEVGPLYQRLQNPKADDPVTEPAARDAMKEEALAKENAPEAAKHRTAALSKWDLIKKNTKDDFGRRAWYLLAVTREAELKKPPSQ